MRIIPSSTSSEHWLTLMTCTLCDHIPDSSPVYKCKLGHTICYPCFQKLVTTGIPICTVCDSDKFTRQNVSTDFLYKLKTKPGIGRPHRYLIDRACSISPSSILRNPHMYGFNAMQDTTVTVEKLFQLPKEKIDELFDENTKDKIRKLHSMSREIAPSRIDLKNEKRDEIINTTASAHERNSKMYLKKSGRTSKTILNIDSTTSLQSRKPLKCPHDPCNKIIAISSFLSHFKYEHCDFKRFNLERNKELSMVFDPSIIQHDKTFCIGIINLYEKYQMPPQPSYDGSTSIARIAKTFNKKTEIDTFWIMVSGSPDDRPNHAYAIYWLFTNNNDYYNCTLELSAAQDHMTSTAFCGVNGMHESQNISQITQRLNCLYLTQGTLRGMLSYGPMLKLRIYIH